MSSPACSSDDGSTTSDCCSECDGPLPWEETDPHADAANGKFCAKCGHFYGVAAFEEWEDKGFQEEDSCALQEYCFNSEWTKARKRIAYAPQEASNVGWRNSTPLKWAIYNQAPVDLVQALVDAHPEAVTIESDYVGCPLWLAIFKFRLHEYLLKICKIMVAGNNHVLRLCPSEVTMEGVLGHCSKRYNGILEIAANLPRNNQYKSKEAVFAYTTCPGKTAEEENNSQQIVIKEGAIDRAFRLLSLFVHADYHKSLDEDETTIQFSLLHSIAGCRDPFFREKGLLALAIRFYPEQLVLRDENGNCPLHVAVSTVNRDKSDYYPEYYYDNDDGDDWAEEAEAWRREKLQDEFGHCPHHNYTDFDEYLEEHPCQCADCDRDGLNGYCGCKCGRQQIEYCDSCFVEYINKEEDKCGCYEKFEKTSAENCNCKERFEWYYDKMKGEHRTDKKLVIEMLAEASPKSVGLRDKNGNLPMHVALSHGMRWECGVQALAKAHPAAMTTKDPENKLYPFLFAASCDDVDTAFEILRAKPEVLAKLSPAIEQSSTSSGKKRKYITSNNHDDQLQAGVWMTPRPTSSSSPHGPAYYYLSAPGGLAYYCCYPNPQPVSALAAHNPGLTHAPHPYYPLPSPFTGSMTSYNHWRYQDRRWG